MTSFARLHRDVTSWTKQDRHADARFTTFVDLHRLPRDFPGFAEAMKKADPYVKTELLEDALSDAIPDQRFIPYIQVHEFEALIMTDPAKLAVSYPGDSTGIATLVDVRARYANPELIDLNNPPSKQIVTAIPAYRKTVAAAEVSQAIGVTAMRAVCPHFAEWITRLEALR
jgi:hypothetical protein